MMVLADTSIWIDHFRRGDLQLKQFLNREEVVIHLFVIGELALGSGPKSTAAMDDFVRSAEGTRSKYG